MKLSVINGKVIPGKVVGRRQTHVGAPSPAEIAARAYDRAAAVALAWFPDDEPAHRELMRQRLESAKAGELAELRDEVIRGKKG